MIADTSFAALWRQSAADVTAAAATLDHQPAHTVVQAPRAVEIDEEKLPLQAFDPQTLIAVEVQPMVLVKEAGDMGRRVNAKTLTDYGLSTSGVLCDSSFAELWANVFPKEMPPDDLRMLSSSFAGGVIPSADEHKQAFPSESFSDEQCRVSSLNSAGPVPMQVVTDTWPGLSDLHTMNLAGPSHLSAPGISAEASSPLGLFSKPDFPSANPVSASDPSSVPLLQRLRDYSDLNSTILSLLVEDGVDKIEPLDFAAESLQAQDAKVDVSSLLVLHPPGVRTTGDGDIKSKPASSQLLEPGLLQQVRQRELVCNCAAFMIFRTKHPLLTLRLIVAGPCAV